MQGIWISKESVCSSMSEAQLTPSILGIEVLPFTQALSTSITAHIHPWLVTTELRWAYLVLCTIHPDPPLQKSFRSPNGTGSNQKVQSLINYITSPIIEHCKSLRLVGTADLPWLAPTPFRYRPKVHPDPSIRDPDPDPEPRAKHNNHGQLSH